MRRSLPRISERRSSISLFFSPPPAFRGGRRANPEAAVIAAVAFLHHADAPAQPPKPKPARSAAISNRLARSPAKGRHRAPLRRALGNMHYDVEVSRPVAQAAGIWPAGRRYVNSLVAQNRIKGAARMAPNSRRCSTRSRRNRRDRGEVLVAIWGIETSFGVNQGGRTR